MRIIKRIGDWSAASDRREKKRRAKEEDNKIARVTMK